MLNPAIFFDRDGVINHNHGYVNKRKDFYFIEGIFDLARRMRQQFLQQVRQLNESIFPVPPNWWSRSNLKDDVSLKSHLGMILQAQKDLSIDLSRFVLIGDKSSDIQACKAAGVGANLLSAAERPHQLSGFDYEIISALHQAIPYLQRVLQ